MIENNNNFNKKYEIFPEKGEGLSKVIINNDILNKKDLLEDQKIKLEPE